VIIRNDDVDRTKPMLTGLRVAIRRLAARAALAVHFRVSEPATVVCTVERRKAGGWGRVGAFRRSVPAETRSLPVPFRVSSGAFRIRCAARDRAGNVGATSAASFSVGS
jgi:hypothetical protein